MDAVKEDMAEVEVTEEDTVDRNNYLLTLVGIVNSDVSGSSCTTSFPPC